MELNSMVIIGERTRSSRSATKWDFWSNLSFIKRTHKGYHTLDILVERNVNVILRILQVFMRRSIQVSQISYRPVQKEQDLARIVIRLDGISIDESALLKRQLERIIDVIKVQ